MALRPRVSVIGREFYSFNTILKMLGTICQNHLWPHKNESVATTSLHFYKSCHKKPLKCPRDVKKGEKDKV